jgi:hypothetical protein
MNPSGSRRIGSRKAAPATVSVKTSVIEYVPLGVIEDVAIVTVLVDEE